MEEGKITPGFYMGHVHFGPPDLTHWPWRGPSSILSPAVYIPIATPESDNYSSDKIPTEVLDILRVKTWRLDASFTDPFADPDPPSWDFSNTLSNTFNSGTFVTPENEAPPSYEYVIATLNDPGWSTIEDAINYKLHPDSTEYLNGTSETLAEGYLHFARSIAAGYARDFSNAFPDPEWYAGVVIYSPVLRVIDGVAKWCLPVDPPHAEAFAGCSIIASESNRGSRGSADSLTAFGTTVALDPPPADAGGWSVTLDVVDYF